MSDVDDLTFDERLERMKKYVAQQGEFHYVKTREDATPPVRMHADDAGYDMSILELSHCKGTVRFYRTGIKVRPPPGMYFDLVARSSITKTGHMLANGFGVIDPGYRGEVLVPLVKVDPAAPDLQLPCRIVQLVPRYLLTPQPVEIDAAQLDDTARGEGGFGSTGTSIGTTST